jgi:hypothetical protein
LNKCPLLSRPARELKYNNIIQSLYTPQLASSSTSFNDNYNQSSNYFSTDEPDFFDNYSNKPVLDTSKKRTVLRKLYPLDKKTKTQYSYLNLLENVSDIFTYTAITKTTKVMNQTAFRTFIKQV